MSSALATLCSQSGTSRGWVGTWSPGIGDPNFVGWLTVVGYLAACVVCWRRFRMIGRPRTDESSGERQTLSSSVAACLLAFLLAFLGFRRRLLGLPARARLRTLWLGLAVILLLLGINKQLDLQTALTEIGRILARRQGWYDNRRRVQAVFIACVALFGLATFRAVLLLARGELRSLRAVLAGTLFLICFVTIRAASFHHIDMFLGTNLVGFRMNWIIELGGIAFIIVGATSGGEADRMRLGAAR
jgi:hypothetical protein